MYKIVLVGDPGVGKTNLLAYFTAKPEVSHRAGVHRGVVRSSSI